MAYIDMFTIELSLQPNTDNTEDNEVGLMSYQASYIHFLKSNLCTIYQVSQFVEWLNQFPSAI